MANFKSYLYNCYDVYSQGGSFTWSKPGDIDANKPILVHVWGAGGAGDDAVQFGLPPAGGGGGGLAVKLIAVSALGATETITVGSGNRTVNITGGASSFGSHCSATGGNGGALNAVNQGSGATYGVGGLGVGGDINRRGGTGGAGYYASTTNNGGGGGGSAPAPYGRVDGFSGGNGYTYAGGGGGGIGGAGNNGDYTGGAGGGSMRPPGRRSTSPSSYYTPEPGGNGLFGPGGSSGSTPYGYVSYGGAIGKHPANGAGRFLIGPNDIYLGGGGGSAGMAGWNTGRANSPQTSGSSGGPGGGGGGSGKAGAFTYTGNSGNGGMLGGGGGTVNNTSPGDGGNGGGGGGCGYNALRSRFGRGGDGLVIIQYARLI